MFELKDQYYSFIAVFVLVPTVVCFYEVSQLKFCTYPYFLLPSFAHIIKSLVKPSKYATRRLLT